MNSFSLLLYSIYAIAAFFFLRFLYLNSFKDAVRRKAFSQAIMRMLVFIPAGVQGALLFCFAGYQLISATGLSANYFPAVFNPLRIIITGSLLLTGNLLIAKAAAGRKGAEGIFYKLILIAGSLFILSLLISNMRYELFSGVVAEPLINYTGDALFILSSLLVLCFTFIKGRWIYQKQSDLLKYFSLASKLVLLFVSATILVKIIFTPHLHA